MTTALDTLLADAAIPTSSRAFDVAAGLRRLAASAAGGRPTPEVERARRAGHRLNIVCRWVLNTSDAAIHVDRLARTTPAGSATDDDKQAAEQPLPSDFDVRGAVVFACLLHLSDQPESAQFWWQLAAGASSRTAAYCLHLHHLALGETPEAQHWFQEVLRAIEDAADSESTAAADTDLLRVMSAMTRYVRRNGSAASTPPPDNLRAEVDRLASRAPSGLVNGPDQQLAARMADFAAARH